MWEEEGREMQATTFLGVVGHGSLLAGLLRAHGAAFCHGWSPCCSSSPDIPAGNAWQESWRRLWASCRS